MSEKYSDQYFNRKELIDKLLNETEFNIHIYGPESLKLTYPDNYKGFVKYDNLNEVYNKSRINLCTHVCHTKSKYINERTILILGSGSLLLVDPVKNLDQLITDKECVYFNRDNIIEKITHILSNYDQYESIKIAGYEKSKEYTWDKWAEKIHKEYCLDNFDKKFYKQLYNLSVDNLEDYWINEGDRLSQIPFKFEVPIDFNFLKYSKDFGFKEETPIEYLYWHYKVNNPSLDYKIVLPKYTKLQPSTKEEFIDHDSWLELNLYLSKIYNKIDVDENLIKVQDIVNNNPYSDINNILQNYFNLIE